MSARLSAAERVEIGAKLLDEKKPGWFERIDVRRLDVRSVNDCVVGQVYGWYDDGLEELGIRSESDWLWGFDANPNLRDGDGAYRRLNDAWCKLIEKRQADANTLETKG